jgi:hypothetical protein
VLLAKGYEVHFQKFAGGPDYLSWRGTLADGLITLMGNARTKPTQESAAKPNGIPCGLSQISVRTDSETSIEFRRVQGFNLSLFGGHQSRTRINAPCSPDTESKETKKA